VEEEEEPGYQRVEDEELGHRWGRVPFPFPSSNGPPPAPFPSSNARPPPSSRQRSFPFSVLLPGMRRGKAPRKRRAERWRRDGGARDRAEPPAERRSQRANLRGVSGSYWKCPAMQTRKRGPGRESEHRLCIRARAVLEIA
jgi:hypothetical protein